MPQVTITNYTTPPMEKKIKIQYIIFILFLYITNQKITKAFDCTHLSLLAQAQKNPLRPFKNAFEKNTNDHHTGTTTFDPTFGSFTLLELVSLMQLLEVLPY
jgi:hypothetical protein